MKSEEYAACKLMEVYGIPATKDNYELYSAINAEKWLMLEKGEITRPKLLVERFADFFGRVGAKADPVEVNKVYMKLLSQAGFMLDGALDTCRSRSGTAVRTLHQVNCEGAIDKAGAADGQRTDGTVRHAHFIKHLTDEADDYAVAAAGAE